MKKNKIILSLLLTIVCNLSYSMDIKGYIQYLKENNLDIEKAKLNLTQAELNYNGAKIDKHPSLSASVSGNKTESNVNYSFNSSLSYDLDIFGKLNNNEKAKLLQLESSKQNLLDIQNQVEYKFIDYYLQLSSTNNTLSIENNKLSKYQQKLYILETQINNGYITSDKLLSIKNTINDLEKNITSLKDSKNNLINNLNTLLNQKTEESILLEPMTFEDLVQLNNPEENILKNITNNPIIKSLLLNILSSEETTKYNQKSYYPTINLGSSLTNTALTLSSLLTNPGLAIFSSINFNFNLNEINNNIELSKINTNLAQNTYKTTYINLFNNIKETSSKYQNSEILYLKSEESYNNYQQINKTYNIQYQNGYLQYSSLLDQEILLFNAQETKLNHQLSKQQLINKLNYYFHI